MMTGPATEGRNPTLRKLANRLASTLQRPLSDWLTAGEAFFFLGLARLIIIGLPFRWWSRILGQSGLEMASEVMVDQAILARVQWALKVGSRYAWWVCNCLTRALAGKALLRRRGLRSTLYLGVTRTNTANGLEAHAWLRCGSLVVTGGDEAESFQVLATFTEPEFPARGG